MRVRRLQGLTGSLPPATYADSTNVANFARAAQDFYNDPNNGYTIDASFDPEVYSKSTRGLSWPGLIELLKEDAKDWENSFLNGGSASGNLPSIINSLNRSFGTNLTEDDMRTDFSNPYQISPFDVLAGKVDDWFNPNAPDPVFDSRILPERIDVYSSSASSDMTDIPSYDPVMVTPWRDLTDDEKKERVDKAIRTGNTEGIPQQALQKASTQSQTMTKTKTKKNPTPFEMPSLPPSQIPVEAMEERGLIPVMRAKSRGRQPQTIYKQDPRVSTGQYPVGERIWDEDKKRWVERMWDKDMQRDARELARPRRENWRTIETPPGGFMNGGKIKVKKKC